MKKILFSIFILLSINAYSYNAAVGWQAPASGPAPDGYLLYVSNFEVPFGAPVADIQQTAYTVQNLPDDRVTTIGIKSYVWGPYDMSGNRTQVTSDDMLLQEVSLPVVKPEKPRNIIITILAAVLDFFENYLAG